MGALAVFAAGKDRLTAVYISLLTLGFSDFGQTHGYGQRVVIAQLVSGIVLLMGALPLLVSGISIFVSNSASMRSRTQAGINEGPAGVGCLG